MKARTLEQREFGRVRRPWLRHPAQAISVGFAGAIAAGTLLLSMPWARSGPGSAGLLEALFTATSAVCVTGLSTVDVPSYWSTAGEVTILVLIQLGGFGIMTFASLVGLLISRRLGLRNTVTAATERSSVGIGDVREVMFGVIKVTVVVEAVVAVLLALRLGAAYDESPGRAVWLGVFHSVSAFNNAGFALWSDSLGGFIGDPWMTLPLCAAVVLGGIGFPVLFELRRRFRSTRAWSVHTRMTLGVTGLLLLAGWISFTASEWSNPGTIGGHDAGTKVLAGFTQSVMARTAGYQSIDFGAADASTQFATTILMFIGGGSGGTAGGIKVTTFILLFFVILAEVRGEPDVEAGHRRIDGRAQRQALTVALLSVGVVVAATMVLMWITDMTLNLALFEATSAFATVGLSAVGTGTLPEAGQALLIPLMFIGRLGPITLVSALALHERQHRYRLPEGRPLIG